MTASEDLDRFRRELQSFAPESFVDIHAHLVPATDCDTRLQRIGAALGGEEALSWQAYQQAHQELLGRNPMASLLFALPRKSMDRAAANAYVQRELQSSLSASGLMLLSPEDDPATIEGELRHGWIGFKPYHLFAPSANTYEANIDEYLPEWAWELAHRHRLIIMLHLVRRRALADVGNQQYLIDHARRYPDARCVLAHAGRGFCGRHTVEGASALRGHENLLFDTSAICEPAPLAAVIRSCGAARLLYGSDFPVSQFRGRCVSVGDGFTWVDDAGMDWDRAPFARPVPLGMESLLALRDACWLTELSTADVEKIFFGNASALLAWTSRF